MIRSIRIALRGLGRTPAFTAAALTILGLGIGTAVAMFTVFRAVVYQRIPVPSPERVMVVSTYKDPTVEFGLVKSDLKVIKQQARTLREIGGYAHWGTSQGPLVDGDRTLTLGRVVVTGGFFDALGAQAVLGRLLKPEDDVVGAEPALVISYQNWQRWFGGDPKIVGHHLYEPYSQQTYTIVGVAPAGLDFPTGAGYWLTWPSPDSTGGLSVIAVVRLAPGASIAAAKSEFVSIVKRTPIPPWRTAENGITGAKVVPFTEAMLGDIRPALIALSAAVVLLLVIACVNVGGLLLLRASARARELAIRRALGATYADVTRHLLLESSLLAVAGGLLGLLCAVTLIHALIAAPFHLPRLDVIELSDTPVFIAIGTTLLAVLLFGVVPSLLAARTDVASALRLDSRSGRDTAARRRFRHVLVAAQTALALVMLAGGGLLARSLVRLESIDLGYASDHLTHLATSWPQKKYDSVSKYYPLGEDILRRWRAIPGVVSLTPELIPPLVGENVFLARVDKEGQSPSDYTSNLLFPELSGDKDYFRTFGMPIIRGRAFADADREDAPLVAIVSEMAAKRLWPGEDPIGKRIHYLSDSAAWRTVVGIVGDARIRALRTTAPIIYVPWRQMDFWQFSFAVRTRGDVAPILSAMRHQLTDVDPQLKLWYVHSMDELLGAPLAQPRMSTLLMSVFAVAALLLAAIGLYGLMASLVRERTREIGIRMALGALPEVLRRDVLLQALTVSGAGALVGLLAAVGTSRLLSAILFEVSPTDPIALASACGVLMLVVLIAAYVPARRATKIDPASALRAD